jgi:hypothetical protein
MFNLNQYFSEITNNDPNRESNDCGTSENSTKGTPITVNSNRGVGTDNRMNKPQNKNSNE